MTAKFNTRNVARKTLRRLAMAATLAFVAAGLSACGSAGSGEQGAGNGQEEPRKVVVERTVIVKEEAGANAAANTKSGGGSSATGEQTEERDGTYAVGDGGEVEFERTDQGLRLVEARPNPGWTTEINDRGPEDIDVEFRRDNVEWQFDAEIDDGGILLVDPADRDMVDRDDNYDDGGGQATGGGQAGDRDGAYTVGNGGEVEFVREGNSLRLVEARPNPGWDPLVNDRGPEDVGVEFRKGNVEWQFDAEIEDGGILVVDPADKDIEGPERFDD